MNDLQLDPESVRGFGDDVYTELETTVRPWIAEIVAELGTRNPKGNNGFGAHDVAYGAPGLDQIHASGVSDLKRWLADLSTGLEALALGSAVLSEQLAGTDIDAALMLDKKSTLNDNRGMAV